MAKRGGFGAGMMPGNMNNLMKQAQRMQKQMEETTKELEDKVYESSVGGGVVTAKVSGRKELLEIKIDPEGAKGTIGIIGPKRMDYKKVVTMLKNLTGELDDIFSEKEQEDR